MASRRPGRALGPGFPRRRLLPAFLLGSALALISPSGAVAANRAIVVRPSAPAPATPRSWFGLSMEYDELPLFASHTPAFLRFASLLRVRADGPQLVRIGGNSADYTFTPGDLQPGGYPLTGDWFATGSKLIRAAGWRTELDLNLRSATPVQAADEARAELTGLPAGSVAGFEVGNEPNLYPGYSATAYAQAFAAYAQRLDGLAGHVPLAGPALAGLFRDAQWLPTLLSADRPALSELSIHLYPLSNCAQPGQRTYPTIAKLLSPQAIADVARAAARVRAVAHAAGLPLRVDELNSVTCHGRPGVSDTFATALWAPDTLFSLLGTGVSGVNVHIRPTTVNGPLSPVNGGFRARPLMYGLTLFARALSPGGALLRERFSLPAGLKAYAVRVPGPAYRLLLINERRQRRSVLVRLPGAPGALVSLQRLLAPGVRALAGVTLAGQRLGLDGRWQGGSRVSSLSPGPHGYPVMVPGYSAALLSTGAVQSGRRSRPRSLYIPGSTPRPSSTQES